MSHRVSLPLPLSRPDGCQVRGAAGFRGNNEIECLFRFPGLGLVAGVARVPHQSFTLAGILLQCVTCRFASFFCVRGVCEKRLIWNLPWEPPSAREVSYTSTTLPTFPPRRSRACYRFENPKLGVEKGLEAMPENMKNLGPFFTGEGKKRAGGAVVGPRFHSFVARPCTISLFLPSFVNGRTKQYQAE